MKNYVTWLFPAVMILISLALLAVMARLRKKKRFFQKQKENIEEILSTSPEGFFYFLKRPKQEICSRRLSVLLGIYESHARFEDLLRKLSAASQKSLKKAVEKLCESGQTFSMDITDITETLHLTVMGQRAALVDGTVVADVLWFQNKEDSLNEVDKIKAELKALQARDYLFMNALDNLPFAFWLRNFDLTLAFCNRAYLKQSGASSRKEALEKNMEIPYEAKDKMGGKILAICAKSSGEVKKERAVLNTDGHPHLYEFTEVPLGLDRSPDERYNLGFSLDVQKEENIRQALDTYLMGQHQVLSGLSAGVILFDSNGYLQFYNKAFCTMWHLEEEWLFAKPSYAGILDRLREKRLLPEEANFLQYKHKQLEEFSTLTDMDEQFLYLPDGRILRKVMTPYPLGGVVMIFEDVTDRVSLERSFNEQIAIQKALINQMPEGIIVFNGMGRLKLYNEAYVKMFLADENFLKGEPLLMDVLESQRDILSKSEDVWHLLKQKILLAFEQENEQVKITFTDKRRGVLSVGHLPDGGLLLTYKKNRN